MRRELSLVLKQCLLVMSALLALSQVFGFCLLVIFLFCVTFNKHLTYFDFPLFLKLFFSYQPKQNLEPMVFQQVL